MQDVVFVVATIVFFALSIAGEVPGSHSLSVLQFAEQRVCCRFWVAQRFSAAIKALFFIAALSAEGILKTARKLPAANQEAATNYGY